MSDSSVQIATVVISVAALVFSTTAAFWSLVYNRRQARAVAEANALTERARREQAEPYVIVDIKPRDPRRSERVGRLWGPAESAGAGAEGEGHDQFEHAHQDQPQAQ